MWKNISLWIGRLAFVIGAGACSGNSCCPNPPDLADIIDRPVGEFIDCNASMSVKCLGEGKDATKVVCNCDCQVENFPGSDHFLGAIDVCLPPDLNVALADATQRAQIDAMTVNEYAGALAVFCGLRVAESLRLGFHQDYGGGAFCQCSGAGFTGTEISNVCTTPCSAIPCTGTNCGPTYDPATNAIDPNRCVCHSFQFPDGTLTEPLCSSSPVLTGMLPDMVGSQSTVDIDSSSSTVSGTISFEDPLGFDHSDSVTSIVSGNVILAGRTGTDGNTRLGLDLRLTATDGEFFFDLGLLGGISIPIRAIKITGETPYNAVVLNASGNGEIPTNALTVRIESVINPRRVLVTGANDRPIPITVNFASRTFSIPALPVDLGNGAGGSIQLNGTVVNQPPTTKAGPDQIIECTQPAGGPATLDGRESFDPDLNMVKATWIAGAVNWDGTGIAGQGLLAGVLAPFTPPMKTSTYSLMTRDERFQIDVDTVDVTVRDTTAPAIGLATMAAFEVCGSGTQALVIKQPTVTDACSNPGDITLTGAVVASSNIELTLPIQVQNTNLAIGVGTHTIRWRASDQSGNTRVVDQTIEVRPAFYATESLRIADRVTVGAAAGPFAPIANRGSVFTQIGVEARVGDIRSVAAVDLRDRAVVGGSVRSSGAVTIGNQVSISGNVLANVAVPLPPPPALGVTFPSTHLGDVLVPPDQAPPPLAPGAYAQVVINPRATLTLMAGRYFFDAFDLEPQAILKVQPTTEIFVRNVIIHRGTIQGRPLQVGYAGTATVFLEAPFDSRLTAPNAEVVVRRPFAGELAAKSISIDPDVVASCRAVTGN